MFSKIETFAAMVKFSSQYVGASRGASLSFGRLGQNAAGELNNLWLYPKVLSSWDFGSEHDLAKSHRSGGFKQREQGRKQFGCEIHCFHSSGIRFNHIDSEEAQLPGHLCKYFESKNSSLSFQKISPLLKDYK